LAEWLPARATQVERIWRQRARLSPGAFTRCRHGVDDGAVDEDGGTFQQRATTANSRTWKIALEHKF